MSTRSDRKKRARKERQCALIYGATPRVGDRFELPGQGTFSMHRVQQDGRIVLHSEENVRGYMIVTEEELRERYVPTR